MRKNIFTLLIIVLIFGCEKDEPKVVNNVTLEPYIRNLISPDFEQAYEGNYYIYANFTNLSTSEKKELLFNVIDQRLSMLITSDNGLGMSIQGVALTDSTTKEKLEISFYYNNNEDSIFNIYYANYYYADPWRNIAGANIEYFLPPNDSDSDSRYRYLGTNSNEYYFEIRYIGDNRLNGVFKTKWKECCGVKTTYNVFGDFSIPIDKLWNTNLR